MSGQDSLPSNQCGECAKLHAQIERLDDDLSEVMGERDRATEALAQTHIALGGDGEWTGKLPPEPTPHSGDLHDDVPALAEELRAEIERLQGLLGSALKLLDDARPVMDADMTAFRSYGEWRDAEIALMTATYGVARLR